MLDDNARGALAETLATRWAYEVIESECLRVDEIGHLYALLDSHGVEVECLIEAPEDVQEAVSWLQGTGRLEVVEDGDGETLHVKEAEHDR